MPSKFVLTMLRGLELSWVSLRGCEDEKDERLAAGKESDEAGGRVTRLGSVLGCSEARLTGSWENMVCCSWVSGGGK